MSVLDAGSVCRQCWMLAPPPARDARTDLVMIPHYITVGAPGPPQVSSDSPPTYGAITSQQPSRQPGNN